MYQKERFQNNYDFLRVFAAMGVIYFHSFALLNQADVEPLSTLTYGKINFSLIRLGIFFSLSGYLIAKSIERSTSIKSYLWKRFLRIQPLLIVVCILTVLLLGVCFTNLSSHNYFEKNYTWKYFRNIFPVFGLQFTLPGVFTNNIYEAGVNGSLWTLIIEERLYLLMCIFFLFRRNKGIYFTMFVLIFDLFYMIHSLFFDSKLILAFNRSSFLYTLLFLNSSAMYFLKIDFLKRRTFFLSISSICLLIAIIFPLFKFLYLIAIPLFVNSVAQIKGFINRIGKYGDFSYGLYILSFPIQQMLIAMEFSKNPYKLFGLTVAITLPLAVLSWHLIEKKILRLRNVIK